MDKLGPAIEIDSKQIENKIKRSSWNNRKFIGYKGQLEILWMEDEEQRWQESSYVNLVSILRR